MAVNFYIDKRTDKKGDAPIRISVTIGGARLLTSTGYKIAPTKWDAARQQIRRGSTNASGITYAVINAALAKIAEHFATFENECLAKGVHTDAEALKREFAVHFGRKQAAEQTNAKERILTFWDYYKMFVDEMGTKNQWSIATHQKFAALENHITDYNPKVSFESLNEKGLTNFVAFLREEKEMKNSTISKQLGFLKWFLRWATAKG